MSSVFNLCDQNAFVSDSAVKRPRSGEEHEKASSHWVNLSNSIKRCTESTGWFNLFKDGVSAFIKWIELRLIRILSAFVYLTSFVDCVSVLQDIFRYRSSVLANKFPISPDSVLRPVNLVHDEGHKKIHNSIGNSKGLVDNKTTSRKESVPNIGSKQNYKEDRMSAHPFLIPHDFRIVSETVADPDKGHEQKNTVNQQEHTRNNVVGPIVKSLVVITRNSAINTNICKPD
jgi:hypothetical protein